MTKQVLLVPARPPVEGASGEEVEMTLACPRPRLKPPLVVLV